MDTATLRSTDLKFEEVLRLARDPQTSLLTIRYIALMIHIGQTVEDDRRTVKALARDLDLPKPSVSRGLDALEARGWITRIEHPADKRMIFARITNAGRACAIFAD